MLLFRNPSIIETLHFRNSFLFRNEKVFEIFICFFPSSFRNLSLLKMGNQSFSVDQDSLKSDCSEYESEDSIREPDNIAIEDLIVESTKNYFHFTYS